MNPRVSGTLSRVRSFRHSLSQGDRFLLYIFLGAFGITLATSAVALERSFMVIEPEHGGSLVEGIVGAPRFVNPLLAISDSDRDLATLTYAGLMGRGPDGLTPVLAESYDVSPDGKQYTFHLRPNATWSDGQNVTAEDVVFTISKAVDPALKSPELANWSNVKVEALDAHTVRFTLPKAYAPFLGNTTLGILPAHVWMKIPDEQFPFTTYMSRPIGAGPYVVDGVKTDDSGAIIRYDVKANKHYVLGEPYISSIRFVTYTANSDLLVAYENGAVDSAYGIPVAGALRAPYSRIFGIFLNPANNKALGDDAVRSALSLAIDRDHLTGTILGGYAKPRTSPLPTGDDEEHSMPSNERIAAAKQILIDAGWKYDESTGTWSNAKKGLTLGEISIKTSNIPELKLITGEIEKNWEAIGVKTALEYYEPNTLTSDVIRTRNYAALYFGLVVGAENDLYAFWDSNEKSDPGLNIAMYANKSVDTLLEKARTETDEAKREEDLTEASQIIAREHGALFTHTPYFVYAVPKGLKGVILPEITTPSDRFATVATWYLRSHYVWPFFSK